MTEKNSPKDREIVLCRMLNAPRELVFEAYTDPNHVKNWWGPRGFTITTREMDVRPGGLWRFIFHAPDGSDSMERIEYLEVVKPERLVFFHGGEEDGVITGRFHVTITFVERGAQTEVTSRLEFDTAGQRDETVNFGAIELGNQTFDRLKEYLAAGMTGVTH